MKQLSFFTPIVLVIIKNPLPEQQGYHFDKTTEPGSSAITWLAFRHMGSTPPCR
ncbi:hypothetical protein [Bacteroides sp.]|uniref:hypothetical protein n=1 Tax=Bacteroides sp. TaxID=29523 RepID=UPI0025BC8FB5|nr:hypothetical protein [Bacteroides sp.]